MEGKINKNGYLSIMRGGKIKAQDCPYTSVQGEELCSCGDWCPLFREPNVNASGFASLTICNAILSFDKFSDERIVEPIQTATETSEIGPTINAEEKTEELPTSEPMKSREAEIEQPKKKRGRPRKVRPTDEEILNSVNAKEPLPTPKEPSDKKIEHEQPIKDEKGLVYHEPCKTCRKSRRNSEGNYPMCDVGYFEKTLSGTEVCPLWWERKLV